MIARGRGLCRTGQGALFSEATVCSAALSNTHKEPLKQNGHCLSETIAPRKRLYSNVEQSHVIVHSATLHTPTTPPREARSGIHLKHCFSNVFDYPSEAQPMGHLNTSGDFETRVMFNT